MAATESAINNGFSLRHASGNVLAVFILILIGILAFSIRLLLSMRVLFTSMIKVVCAVCDTEQPVGRVCTNCGVSMGEYFCEICKFYDDDVHKKQFHCDDCGICR